MTLTISQMSHKIIKRGNCKCTIMLSEQILLVLIGLRHFHSIYELSLLSTWRFVQHLQNTVSSKNLDVTDCGCYIPLWNIQTQNKGTYRRSKFCLRLFNILGYLIHVSAFYGHHQVHKVTKYSEQEIIAAAIFSDRMKPYSLQL
jgi:hypothetical protein